MRAADLESHRIDEIGPLISVKNWFEKKFHDILATGSQKLGQGEMQKFTNQHLRAFMQMMGRYNMDWPTVTMSVVYQYMKNGMHLSNEDIADVVAEALRNPELQASVRKLTIGQIQDKAKQLVVATLTKNPKVVQPAKVVEMLLITAAMRQMERHWEKEQGTEPMPAQRQTGAARASTGQPRTQAAASKAASAQQQTTGATQAAAQSEPEAAISDEDIDAALKALEALA